MNRLGPGAGRMTRHEKAMSDYTTGFRGEGAGEIVDQPRGSNGFGYDPYFLYEPFRAHLCGDCAGAEAGGEPQGPRGGPHA